MLQLFTLSLKPDIRHLEHASEITKLRDLAIILKRKDEILSKPSMNPERLSSQLTITEIELAVTHQTIHLIILCANPHLK